ncbi:hypothetical protein FRC96_06955 [Lujinxingia vulgaris]|uniref:Uncharacterized protein n=1 Tax=Lujinxingia vulgaris TaxID=2600176 RepID=A0A5C6XMV0_9DELT|nr:hypothetical protein [Lujinxingia vulgaris]TXD39590.1 hypothetical protein FRC96_06955 [Lujinxingia vulgaris]
MTHPLTLDSQTRDLLSPVTTRWFHQSELAADPLTARLVAAALDLRDAPGLELDDDIAFAVLGAYFCRALEVATVDGERLTRFDDIPGGLDDITLAVLKGYATRTAFRRYCVDGESQIGGAILNIVARQVAGKKANRWSFDALIQAYGEEDYVPSEVHRLHDALPAEVRIPIGF